MKQEWLLTYIIFMSAEKRFYAGRLMPYVGFPASEYQMYYISDFYTQYPKG